MSSPAVCRTDLSTTFLSIPDLQVSPQDTGAATAMPLTAADDLPAGVQLGLPCTAAADNAEMAMQGDACQEAHQPTGTRIHHEHVDLLMSIGGQLEVCFQSAVRFSFLLLSARARETERESLMNARISEDSDTLLSAHW